MQVWKICRAKYQDSALTGTGARLFAGRWNNAGVPVVYTSRNLALASVEFFVNLDPGDAPSDLVSIRIEIPDDLEVERIDEAGLPGDWRRMDNRSLRDLGSSGLTSGRTVALEVPSAVVKGERNLLLNPDHPDFHQVKQLEIQSFQFDERMFQKSVKSPIDFARSQQTRFLEELKSLLRIPSISTLPEHTGDVRLVAESLAREMERIGLEHVRIIETAGHP